MLQDHDLCTKQPGIISILSLINNPPSPGKCIFSDKRRGERGKKTTDGDKSQWRSQVRQIEPMPVNQVMQRLFTFAENTRKFSWQKELQQEKKLPHTMTWSIYYQNIEFKGCWPGFWGEVKNIVPFLNQHRDISHISGTSFIYTDKASEPRKSNPRSCDILQ